MSIGTGVLKSNGKIKLKTFLLSTYYENKVCLTFFFTILQKFSESLLALSFVEIIYIVIEGEKMLFASEL